MVEMDVKRSTPRRSLESVEEQPISNDRHDTLLRVHRVVRRLRPGERLRVLSVGNRFGDLSELLEGHDVIQQACRTSRSGQGGGDAPRVLPYEDRSFDLILFHEGFHGVPPRLREAFLEEAVRVTRTQILIVSPFSEAMVESARRVVNAFYRLTVGMDHRALLEDTDRFLPDLVELLMWTKRGGLEAMVFPHGQLFTWTIMACLRAYMDADRGERPPFEPRRLFGTGWSRSTPSLLPPSRIVLLSKSPLSDLRALDDERFGPEATRFLTGRFLSVLRTERDEEFQRLSRSVQEGDRKSWERVLEDTVRRERFFLGFKDRVREFVGKDRRGDEHGFGDHLMGFAESLTRMKPPVIDLAEQCFARHPDAVCACLAHYLRRRPDQGEAWNDLGLFLMEKGEWEDAKKALVNACLLDYELAYRNLAFLYLRQGDLEGAVKIQQEATRKNLDRDLFRGWVSSSETISAEA